MTTMWGPALDAEVDYRRATMIAVARRRRGRRAGRARSRTAGDVPGGSARRARPARPAGVPAVAGAGSRAAVGAFRTVGDA